MKQFWNILKFELSSYFKNKVFIGITVVLVVVISAVLSFPQMMSFFDSSSDGSDPTPDGGIYLEEDDSEGDFSEGDDSLPIIAVVDSTSLDATQTQAIFESYLFGYEVVVPDEDIDALKESVEQEIYASALVINSPSDYSLIIKDNSMFSSDTFMIDEIMQTKYRIDALSALGVSPEDSATILSSQMSSEVITMGKDQMQNFFYTYILIFGLYVAILLYGNLVATGVASEKSSRAMEVLITSAKPSSLMFGKVLGGGLAGLIQMSVILLSAFIAFTLNKTHWEDNFIIRGIFDMPLEIILYTILFFMLGYSIYSFLYGAVGSLASKVEDINTSAMPITFLFIIGFFIVVTSMSSGNVDSTLMVVASFIPFTSPMAMFTRIAMGNVTSIEIILSVIILIVSTIGIGVLSAKIYRMGVLMYGKPPKITSVIKTIFSKQA